MAAEDVVAQPDTPTGFGFSGIYNEETGARWMLFQIPGLTIATGLATWNVILFGLAFGVQVIMLGTPVLRRPLHYLSAVAMGYFGFVLGANWGTTSGVVFGLIALVLGVGVNISAARDLR